MITSQRCWDVNMAMLEIKSLMRKVFPAGGAHSFLFSRKDFSLLLPPTGLSVWKTNFDLHVSGSGLNLRCDVLSRETDALFPYHNSWFSPQSTRCPLQLLRLNLENVIFTFNITVCIVGVKWEHTECIDYVFISREVFHIVPWMGKSIVLIIFY